jgi:hypothetical protein
LADHQPVKQHPNDGEVLFHCWCRQTSLKLLNIGCHYHRLNLFEFQVSALTPNEEPCYGTGIGKARVLIPDIGCKELYEAPRGLVAGVRDDRWQTRQADSA